MLQVRHATHHYGATLALDGVNLIVGRGECIGLLGPNGAGKSTLVSLSVGLLQPQGETDVRVAGGDPRRAETRRRIGVVQQTVGLPPNLTVRELVRGAAIRVGASPLNTATVLTEAGLTELADRRAGRLSGGEAQRTQLAMALVGEPELLILDEPTVGLDVEARRAFWTIIRARRDRGAGVLLTTHIVEEAARAADRVALLHRGRLLADEPPETLSARLPDRTITARTRLDVGPVRGFPGVLAVERDGPLLRIAARRAEPVVAWMLERDPDLSGLTVAGAGLEDALIALTRTSTQDVAA